VPWLLATQIAEGLERFAFPTRAEICDLAHWLQEGCAGVLLSYETAFGRRPVDAVAAVAALLAHWGTTPAAPGRSPTGRGLGGTDEGALP
jgi:pyruvate kinase